MTRTADPLILTLSKAAKLCDTERHVLTKWLEEDDEFRKAVVIALPGKRVRISKPRLERFLHGEVAQ